MPDSLMKQEEVKFGWYHVISADHILNFLKFSRVDGAVVRFQIFQVLGLTTDGDTMMRFAYACGAPVQCHVLSSFRASDVSNC